LDLHLTFINKLQDSIDNGIGNLVDADLAKESAKIQSLQTRQQLGVQALAIANASTQTLLSLFR
jgi:flagellin